MDSSSETNSTSSFTCGVHASVEHLLDVLQELRLGSTWVSKQENVDVSSDSMLTTNVLAHSSKHS